MKFVKYFLLLVILISCAVPVSAQDDDFPFDLRHHVNLPQPVMDGGSIGVYATGYHFTLFTVWDIISFGGIGTGFGFIPQTPDGSDERSWNARLYMELPLADISLRPGGYEGETSFEFNTAVMRGFGSNALGVSESDWAIRALFSVGWQ